MSASVHDAATTGQCNPVLGSRSQLSLLVQVSDLPDPAGSTAVSFDVAPTAFSHFRVPFGHGMTAARGIVNLQARPVPACAGAQEPAELVQKNVEGRWWYTGPQLEVSNPSEDHHVRSRCYRVRNFHVNRCGESDGRSNSPRDPGNVRP